MLVSRNVLVNPFPTRISTLQSTPTIAVFSWEPAGAGASNSSLAQPFINMLFQHGQLNLWHNQFSKIQPTSFCHHLSPPPHTLLAAYPSSAPQANNNCDVGSVFEKDPSTKICHQRLPNFECHQRLPNSDCRDRLPNFWCRQRQLNFECHQRLPNFVCRDRLPTFGCHHRLPKGRQSVTTV